MCCSQSVKSLERRKEVGVGWLCIRLSKDRQFLESVWWEGWVVASTARHSRCRDVLIVAIESHLEVIWRRGRGAPTNFPVLGGLTARNALTLRLQLPRLASVVQTFSAFSISILIHFLCNHFGNCLIMTSAAAEHALALLVPYKRVSYLSQGPMTRSGLEEEAAACMYRACQRASHVPHR